MAAPETTYDFLLRQGIGDNNVHKQWFSRGQILVDGQAASRETLLHADISLTIRGKDYQVTDSPDGSRLVLHPIEDETPKQINEKVRVHCGYHKCLTMFFRRVSKKTAVWHNPLKHRFRHFFHRVDEFYADCMNYSITSVSGHCLDLDRFSDIRAVHMIRDPRDMIVSGYHYHKRAAEHWCSYRNPSDEDWAIVNAPVPPYLPSDTTFAAYLNDVSVEQGLLAEIDFRKNHFENMMTWPTDDERVLTVKYEDVLGNESKMLGRIYDFYGASFAAKYAAKRYGARYSVASPHRLREHIRNPSFGQWRDVFTPAVSKAFNEKYTPLLEKFGYPSATDL